MEDLREQSAREITAIDFDGYAIGGLSVGEPEPEMLRMAELTAPMLPADRPRYAMGLGTPVQLVELVARGVDMFDCVLPTRLARNGTAFTFGGAISLKGQLIVRILDLLKMAAIALPVRITHGLTFAIC